MLLSAYQRVIIIGCLVLTLSGCLQPPGPASPSGTAVKGYELYSWQDDSGAWKFALLIGTNRLKTEPEIQAAALNEQDLLDQFRGLEAGQTVFWIDSPGALSDSSGLKLQLPPAETVAAVSGSAEEQGVALIWTLRD